MRKTPDFSGKKHWFISDIIAYFAENQPAIRETTVFLPAPERVDLPFHDWLIYSILAGGNTVIRTQKKTMSMYNPMRKDEPAELIKVAIADDHILFRAGVKTALSMQKDIRMVGEADNGMQLLNLLKHITPDVILLDIQMPIMDGITTLPEIKKLYPEIRVIMLTMHNDHSMISKLMELGANAYLTKNSDSEVIYEAVRTVYEQEYFFNQLTNKALIDGLRVKRQAEAAMPVDAKLTEKEITILKMMCEEKSTKEIADLVDLSPRTVEAIRDKLKNKTGAKSMAGLVMYAVKSGIIENK